MVRDSPIVELGVASPDWIALDGEPPHAGNGNFVCVGIVCDVCAPTPWEHVQSFVMNRRASQGGWAASINSGSRWPYGLVLGVIGLPALS